MLLSNSEASINRMSSLFGTGCGTEIVIGSVFAARLLSLMSTLPVNCSYCIRTVSIVALMAWNELNASSFAAGFCEELFRDSCALVAETVKVAPSNSNVR